MDRREFMKMLGVGGLLIGAGTVFGAGCAEEEEPPPFDPDAEMLPEEPPDGPAEPADDAAEADDAGATQATVNCPNCDAENEVDEWGVEITCWRCGHSWTPQEPA